MRIVPTPRSLPVAWWLIVAIAAWGGVVAIAHILRVDQIGAPTICHLYRFTGIPCATCGSTRAFFAFARGELLIGLLHNPFVVAFSALFACLLTLRLVFARRIELRPKAQRIMWIILAAAFAVNWIYVIAWHEGMIAGPHGGGQ